MEIITIDYINEKGYGVGFINDKEYWILNSLPQEKVEIEVYKKKKGIRYGKAINILTASPHRQEAKTDHFLACSPLQIATDKYKNTLKQQILERTFKEYTNIVLQNPQIIEPKENFHYRNKMEYSFYADENEHLHLAFHKRDSHKGMYLVDECLLAPTAVNKTASQIIEFLNSQNVKKNQLKGLTIRYSFYENKSIAVLFCKDPNLSFELENLRKIDSLKSFFLNYSDPKSPAFVITKTLDFFGDEFLLEKIGEQIFQYPYYGFFQVNPGIFEATLDDIRDVIKDIAKPEDTLIDLYSGVGTIGIAMAQYVKKVFSVEAFEKSREYSLINSRTNNISNISFIEGKAEEEYKNLFGKADLIVVDPPRSGLHIKLVNELISSKINTIIYLSCNPKTQAQNIAILKEYYEPKFINAYDFFPNTPHIECLFTLTRKI